MTEPEYELKIHSGPLPPFMRTISCAFSSSLHENLNLYRAPSSSQVDLDELRRIIESGGISTSATLDSYVSSNTDASSQLLNQGDIFNVLAIDIASTQSPGFFSDPGELLGKQTCWIRSSEAESSDDNWYRRALAGYFNEKPFTSLLSYPVGTDTGLRWWVAEPIPKKNPRTVRAAKQGFEGIELRWDATFDPNPASNNVSVPMQKIQRRFEAFGRHVFSQLSQSIGVAATATTALIWVYVGPPSANEPLLRASPPWGQSLFIVLQPAVIRRSRGKSRPESPCSWLTEPHFRHRLHLAIERLTLILGLSGYSQSSIAKTIWENAHQNCAEMVSHEFKNLLPPLLMHADALYQYCLHDPDTSADLRSRLRRLVFEAWWLSAYAGGFYRLSDRETRARMRFTANRAIEAVAAAATFTLHLLAQSRLAWKVQGPSRTDCVGTLCDIYGLTSEDALKDDFAVSILAFLVSEPARNIRVEHPHPRHSDIDIEVEVLENRLIIRQTTHDTIPPANRVESATIDDLNILLPDEFALVDPIIYTHSVRQLSTRHFVVSRETRILVRGRPCGENEHVAAKT